LCIQKVDEANLLAMELPFLDAPSYKWIFVSGKGGVGKTTTACAIAVTLTRSRGRVLLVSTDPASNIGDTFQQHFSSVPVAVNGFPNLWAMEAPSKDSNETDPVSSLAWSFPGVDEFQALGSLFDLMERDEFDVVVFDTAPTGHTMRLVGMPKVGGNLLSGFGSLGTLFANAAAQLFGNSADNASLRMQKLTALLKSAGDRLVNSMECTFVCVLLPEFLPFYETERFIRFLAEENIESHCLIVNQLLPEKKPEECKFCHKRYVMQQRYLADIHNLYGNEFRVLEVPYQDNEVKGRESVLHFTTLISGLFSPQ
jgi:arsenite-transporting ATPase